MMVDCRIGCTIVDPKAVEFFAKRVAATSGDAQKLLDLIAKAVSKCKEQLPYYRLESSEAGIVVKMPDAMKALRESVNPKYTTLIKGLPSTRRAVLCVAVRLARSRRKESNQLWPD
jgi:Cdc6-like AAA superfamily ATPase